MNPTPVRTLFEALRRDDWRQSHPFSADIADGNAVLHHPFVWRDEAVEALNCWCQGYQPCFFGKFAAKHHQIHFAVLFEKDLLDTDESIAAKIAAEMRLWKQRAINDANYPPHGFLLVVLSLRVALAAPDENLFQFACKIRDLADWSPDAGTAGKDAVSHDFLYLRHPREGLYYGYRFNVDFFAAAGDGRWWHDHRFPGGIAFTANSTGHMRYFREWYLKQDESKLNDWFLTQAMNTVAAAHSFNATDEPKPPTTGGQASTPAAATAQASQAPPPPPKSVLPYLGSPYHHVEGHPANEGRVTWLRDLQGQPPLIDVKCPFTGKVPAKFEDKDWTCYEGLLHTDHAVRPEFFADRDTPLTADRPYRMDLTYLYDRRQQDFVDFVQGVRFAESHVFDEIGRPETWQIRAGTLPHQPLRAPEQTAEVNRLIEICRAWPGNGK